MDLIERIDSINVYKKGNNRAPHKPLYLLLLLASLQKGKSRMLSFSDLDPILARALRIFGQRTAGVRPEYPFWRLQHDGLSEVIPSSPAAYDLRKGNDDPKKSSLLSSGAQGGLVEADYEMLKSQPGLFSHVCHRILDNHFPLSLHEDILNFFGIMLDRKAVKEDDNVSFRAAVLAEYGYRCSISGFESNAEVRHVGIEATELIWQNHGGDATASNAIAMTTLHRKLFHFGLFTITGDYKVKLSPLMGYPENVGLKNGRSIELPSKPSAFPSLNALDWHHRWVFRG